MPSPDPNRANETLARTPDGRFLYLFGQFDKVFILSTNQATGALTLQGSTTLPNLTDFAISPDGKFAYALELPGTLITFKIDSATGALSQINVQSFPGQDKLAIAPSGRFAYSVTGQPETGNQIAIYMIDSNGIFHHTDTITASTSDTFSKLATTEVK